MNKQENRRFDELLLAQAGSIRPEEEETERINPWKSAVLRIVWGLALMSIQLNFRYLQYLLPTLGVALVYTGFRSLRRENRYFTVSWLIAGAELLWNMSFLALLATPFYSALRQTWWVPAAGYLLRLLLFYFFRKALREVRDKTGREATADPLFWAIVWGILLLVCTFSPFSHSWPVFWFMLCGYVLILRALYRTVREIGDEGYGITAAPVRLGSRTFIGLYVLLCFFTAVLCGGAANHLRLSAEQMRDIPASEAREQLLESGIPEVILNDLPEEIVEQLRDAVRVETKQEFLMLDPKEEWIETGEHHYTPKMKEGSRNLNGYTVYMEMPDRLIYVLVYFEWQKPKAVWQDGFVLSCGREDASLLDSALLYDRKGKSYRAAIPRLTDTIRTSQGFFGAEASRKISGAVGYPFGSERQRGYVLYSMRLPEGEGFYMTIMDYVHSPSPLRLPYAAAEERILSGEVYQGGGKNHIQFVTYFEIGS